MLKIILGLVFCVALFFWMGETKISFHPLRMSVAKPYYMVGWVLMIIGISLIQYQSHKQGIEEGIKSIVTALKSEMK